MCSVGGIELSTICSHNYVLCVNLSEISVPLKVCVYELTFYVCLLVLFYILISERLCVHVFNLFTMC